MKLTNFHLLGVYIVTATGSVSPSFATAQRQRLPSFDQLPDVKAVRKAIPLLQKSAELWTQRTQCTSCHHQSLGSIAMAAAANAGYRVDVAKARYQLSAVRTSREKSRLQMFEGGGAINAQVGFGYALLGFAAAKTPPNELTDAMAFLLLKRQAADGGWVSESHRPPLEDKRETATALAIRGLLAYTPLELRHLLPERISKAREWLIRSKPIDNETRVMRIWGLAWTKAPDQVISAATRELLSKQLPDGSWAQIDGLPGDAYATGQALVVLSASYSWQHPQFAKGIQYLIKTQKPDGSWHVKTRRIGEGLPYFETGFPHGEDQFISYAGAAWAVIALASQWSRDLFTGFNYVPKPMKAVNRPELFAKDPGANRLFHAVAFGTLDDVEKVLKGGVDPNVRNEAGATPLIWASADPAKTKLLLAYKADPKLAAKSGRNALYSAAFSYNGKEACRALLEAGANANAGGIAIGPPLSATCLSLDNERIDMLLRAGAKPYVGFPISPVQAAVIVGDIALVKRLGKANPNLSAVTNDGYGLLFEAIDMDSPSTLDALLEAGCDPNTTAKDNGMTPLHWAAMNNLGHGELVNRLLVAGARADAKTKAGKTPLDLARERGNAPAVKVLTSNTGAASRRAPQAAPPRGEPSSKRPNILFIMGDDHAAYALGADGNRIAQTPNLDALAKSGIWFSRTYCNAPVCTASRQSILTGKVPHSAGIGLLTTPLSANEVTIAELLRDAGYRTGAIGKMHFNSALKHGFETRIDLLEWQDWLKTNPPTPIAPGTPVKPAWKPFNDPARIWLNADVRPIGMHENEMSGAFFVEQAKEFLSQKGEQPFCLWLSFYEPHSPFDFPVEDVGSFDPAKMPVPTVAAGDDKQIPAVFRDLTEQDKQGIQAAYYTSARFLDRQIGKVLKELDRLGLRENTIVVYVGDHGYNLGHHGRFEKHGFFETAVRAPLIVSMPSRFKPGRTSDALVEFIDLAPTLLEACSVKRGDAIQGQSLLPILEGKATKNRDHVYSEYLFEWEEAMIRTDEWKLIYTKGDRDRKDGYETLYPRPGKTKRLYNLKRDPDETHDLGGDAACRKELERLQTMLYRRLVAVQPAGWKAPPGMTEEQIIDLLLVAPETRTP